MKAAKNMMTWKRNASGGTNQAQGNISPGTFQAAENISPGTFRPQRNTLTRTFLSDEEGMGTIEVILIIVVLIGLVIIFKGQLSGLIQKVFNTINTNSDKVTEPMSWIQGNGVPFV